MTDSRVKGELFLRVLDTVVAKWGRNGLEVIGYDPASYRSEEWYTFSDLCGLLSAIRQRLGKNNPNTIYRMGFRTMKDDERWHDVFDDQNPAEIFLSTERQDKQYRVGSMNARTIGPKHVRIDYATDETDPSWFEFYRGLLQGVLELTGRTGVVHLLPRGPDPGVRSYDVKWG